MKFWKAKCSAEDLRKLWVGGPVELDADNDLAKFSPKAVEWDYSEEKPEKKGVALFVDLTRGKNMADLEELVKTGTAYGKMRKVYATGTDLMEAAAVVVWRIADFLMHSMKEKLPFCEFGDVFVRTRYEDYPEIVIAIPDADINDAIKSIAPYLNKLDDVFEMLLKAEADLTTHKEFQYIADTLYYGDPGYDLTENGGNDRDKLRALWTAYLIHADLLKEPVAVLSNLYPIWVIAQNDNEESIGWEDFDSFAEFMNEICA